MTGDNGLYPEMIARLNKMAEAFANEFNSVHSRRNRLSQVTIRRTNFFEIQEGNLSQNYSWQYCSIKKILSKILVKLAASDSVAGTEEGNGKNAKKLADVQFASD